jgi:hypothetical protein
VHTNKQFVEKLVAQSRLNLTRIEFDVMEAHLGYGYTDGLERMEMWLKNERETLDKWLKLLSQYE